MYNTPRMGCFAWLGKGRVILKQAQKHDKIHEHKEVQSYLHGPAQSEKA